jgi:phosphoribosylformylglycinamidine synthase
VRLLAVGSKRFLTNKVDRSVTGLCAQQQCVGPLHIPLANCGVIAHNHFSKTGVAIAIGEQPIKGLIDNPAMARMTVAETITNLTWARLTSTTDIKVAANWMWASKLPGKAPKVRQDGRGGE